MAAIYGCIKAKLKSTVHLIGNMHYIRTAPQWVLYITGVDYAGPILFNDAQLKQGPQKALFICMVAGAVQSQTDHK